MLKAQGVELKRMWDVMIADQKLLQGYKEKGFFSLKSILKRRLNIDIDKTEQLSFVEQDINTFTPTEEQINYACLDTQYLLSCKEVQDEIINRFNMKFLIYHIEMPLIKVLGDCEYEGILIDSDKWIANAIRKSKTLNRCIDLLNTIADAYNVNAWDISIPKSASAVKRAKLESEKITNINWSSGSQVLTFFRRIGCPCPVIKDKDTTSKDAVTEWLYSNTGSKYGGLIELYQKYKSLVHNITSFGIPWIEKYMKPNGRVYTTFRQSNTATGRFQSGNADEGFCNIQQIPKKKLFRHCFIADPGYKFITADYSGCEGVLMSSLSKDFSLKRITELKDIHSYLGTKCWRNIYEYRYKMTGDPKYLELSNTYIMTDKDKEARDRFKRSGLFAIVYGAYPNKVSMIQGFSKTEGKIFIDTIESEVPSVITYVKNNAQFALENGYIIHNDRTNSIRWFPEIIERRQLKNQLIQATDSDEIARITHELNKDLSFSVKSKVEGAARNSPVQASNADLIKEAIVVIDRFIRLYKLDIKLVMQVHDEVVYKYHESLEPIVTRIVDIMRKVANKYLIDGITMNASYELKNSWTK